MKTIIKLLIINMLSLLLIGCTNYHLRKGNEYYDYIAYSKAIPHLDKAYLKNNDPETGIKLADCYFHTGNLDCAETLYKSAYEKGNHSPQLLFDLGQILMANGKHTEAIDYFKMYLQTHRNDMVARMLISSCNSVIQRYRDTTLFELKPIKADQFKNAFSIVEYQNGAVFAADKEVFSGRKTAAWTGNSYLDLYTMKKDTAGNWMEPELLQGDVNGRFHEGPATFSADGNTVYFTRSNYFKKKMTVNAYSENNLKIFKASLIEGKWKNLEEFPYNSDDYSTGHPTLSEDGTKMYFVSDIPGGFGGTDIYMSEWVDGKWSKPMNLGSVINTQGNEMFPYYHTDGALYFSSDAHNTIGGLDVFITYNDGKRWATPENLNYPLNSTKDDFGFSMSKNNQTGFVSSSRLDSDKMYTFDKHPPKFNLFGFAHEKGTKTPEEGVTVEITNSITGEISTVVSDIEGKFKIALKPEARYALLCTKIGCFSKSDEISTIGRKYSEDFYADFEVEHIVIDKPIVLENIYYDFDKWNIRPDAALELDKLVKLLNDNPDIDIEMGSHTDVRGNDQYNQVLSDKRALAAINYLIYQGIDSKRLTCKGYGEKVLVNKCQNGVVCTEAEHQKNRRTEFKVTRIRPKK
jgi:outer membrane protein OmpA-like peptidoglycan-associated protein/tetratricopeptide (TPR) repeat protein